MAKTTITPQVGRTIGRGVVAGVVAGISMAMYAMIAAATYQDTGFFTPLYHIASTFIAPSAMESSMKEAMGGNLYYFSAGPAALGMAIHMMTAIVFGVVFALLVTPLRLRGPVAPVVGVLYGLGVFALMSVAILPAVAELFGGGKPISDMPEMVGYSTFAIEHGIFGLVLGLTLLPRPGYAGARTSGGFGRASRAQAESRRRSA